MVVCSYISYSFYASLNVQAHMHFWIKLREMFQKEEVELNKLASLEATLVRNSAQRLTDSLTGVKCRATSVAKNVQ